MLLQEEDRETFKRWILSKVETIIDADVEVLSDYVIELVDAKDDSEAKIRQNCVESLSDVLPENTTAFVDEIIAALKTRSYVPHATNSVLVKPEPQTQAPQPVSIQSIVGASTSEYLPYQSHTSNDPPPNAPTGPAATRGLAAQHRLPDRPTGASPASYAQQDKGQSSRKRKLKERDTSQPHDGHDTHSNRNGSSDRPNKQTARRGGRHGQGGNMTAQSGYPDSAAMSNAPFTLQPFPEVPPFDPTNPIAFLTMAAAFGINVPGMPSFNAQGEGTGNLSCPDYDTKGYCAAGSICPFQHGGAIAVPADKLPEYDPRFSSITEQGSDGGHGRGRARASFSNPGPTHDRTNTTLVVEQIPRENFTEDDVREFFSNFGTIVDIQMQAYKRLAIVKYDTHDAAKRAYNSPKAVFDNRFVKVYWHKSGSDFGLAWTAQGEVDMDSMNHQDERVLDPEEIRKRQDEAQRLYEERRRKAEEAAAKAEEIERKLQETNAAVLKLKRELAARSRNGTGEEGDDDLDEDISQDLATLQAEAENLFAQRDTHAWQTGGRGRGAFRGGYRGRGAAPFASRGGYVPSYKGGYRGRGGYGSSFNGYRTGVKRLDNRPRRIAVANIEPGSKRDEALRQHLINVPDCTSIEPHPQQPDSLIITFQERYQAEMFLDGAHAIPDVGKLELAWVPNSAFDDMQSAEADDDGQVSDDESAKVKDEEQKAGDEGIDGADVDMDVADDIDQWL